MSDQKKVITKNVSISHVYHPLEAYKIIFENINHQESRIFHIFAKTTSWRRDNQRK